MPGLGLANQAPDIPDINTIAPRCLQTYFRRPVNIRLDIVVMFDVSKDRRSEVAEKWLSDTFSGWRDKWSGGIDGVPLHFFTWGWALLFGCDEFLDDRSVLDSQ